jgi:hypothetical protein
MTSIKFTILPIFLLLCTLSQTVSVQARDDKHFNRGGREGRGGYRSEGYRRGGDGYNGYWGGDDADYAVPLAIGATAAAATAVSGNANDAYQEGYNESRQDIRGNERGYLERENKALQRQRSGNE